MRIALISDIHGNLPALDAVLADIAERTDVAATYHLGDLVGYGPWPNEVVARIGERGIVGISGNYDSTIAADYPHCGCRAANEREEAIAHASYEWTRANVTGQTKLTLGALPFRIDVKPLGGHVAGPTIVFVHGTPLNNLTYWDETRSDDFCRKMAAVAGLRAGDAIAFGHTHVPWHRVVDEMHFINTGSVGRPKDGDARAGYVLLGVNETQLEVDIVRVPYDVARAADAIRASALPDDLADFLLAGGRRVTAPVTSAG